MNQDYKELVEFLGEKFEKIDERFEALENDKLSRAEYLDGQDKILTKLDALLQESSIGNEQDKRKTKVLQIHNDALKVKGILSNQEVSAIEKLQVF